MGYLSHRDDGRCYRLSTHIGVVAAWSAGAVLDLPYGAELAPVAATIGFAHDFGKYTSFFQGYLVTGKPNQLKEHAFISAVWASHLARQEEFAPEFEVLSFLAVLCHHRDLEDPQSHLVSRRWLSDPTALEPTDRRRLEVLDRQIEDLRSQRDEIARDLEEAASLTTELMTHQAINAPRFLRGSWTTTLDEFFSTCIETYGSLYEAWRRLKKRAGPGDLRQYFRLLSLFSALIDADKLHAAQVEPVGRRELPAAAVTHYKELKFAREANSSTDPASYSGSDPRTDPGSRYDADSTCGSGRCSGTGSRPHRIPGTTDRSELVLNANSQSLGAKVIPRDVMQRIREEVYSNAARRILHAPLDQRLFTLTAPTGTGKTLAVMNSAFILREKLAAYYGVVPRIIYALPFTSIIDQNHTVVFEILAQALPDFRCNPGPYLLKHHHLADISYPAGDPAHADLSDPPAEENGHSLIEAVLLTESWQSEIIVTTFVQLLHTLIGYRNRMLKKFNRLARSIVIMDEVQNIPVSYWRLVSDTLKVAAEELDLRLILMTATRPEWFSEGEAVELAGTPENISGFFRGLNRVKVYTDLAPRTLEEAATEFLSHYEADKSYLVVLNTIRSSIDFYHRVEQGLKSRLGEKARLYYLSTNILPVERERRLQELSAFMKDGKKPVLVSTQVVEAGVDLDFDEVWRDIGPLDSIVQVAGRCNRHFLRPGGTVRLIKIVDDKGNSLAARVYGKVHVLSAEQVLKTRPEMQEPDFASAVEEFFSYVRERKDTSESDGILRAMARLRFQRDKSDSDLSVSDFKLIGDMAGRLEVFVAATEEAEQVWERYQRDVLGASDWKERQEAFYRIRRAFYSYLISVPAKALVGKCVETKPLCIPRYLVPEVYDTITGFKLVEEDMFVV